MPESDKPKPATQLLHLETAIVNMNHVALVKEMGKSGKSIKVVVYPAGGGAQEVILPPDKKLADFRFLR